MAPPRLLYAISAMVMCFSSVNAQAPDAEKLNLKLYAEIPRVMPRWIMASAFSPDGTTLALPIDEGELGIYSIDFDPPAPPKELTDDDLKKLEEMIKDLGSDSFAKRQTATRALREMGSIAEPQIRAALEKPDTTEQAMRMRQLLDQIAQSSRGAPEKMAKELQSLSLADDSIRALEFTGDGSKLLVASPGLLSVVDTKTWKEIHRITIDPWIGVDAVWFADDTKIALAIDSEIHIYSAETGKRESTFAALTGDILSVDVNFSHVADRALRSPSGIWKSQSAFTE